MRVAARAAGLAVFTALLAPASGIAQEWQASARVGRVSYEGAPAGAAAASSLVLGLGRTGLRDWFGASAALPIDEEPFWAVLGGWKRLETGGRAGILLDLSGHGFIQRHTVTTTGAPVPGPLPGPTRPIETDLSGEGIGAELMAGGYAGAGTLRPVRLEARAGVAAQRSRLGGVLQERGLPTGDAKLALVLAPVTLRAETRGWLDDGVSRAYAGGSFHWMRGSLQLWGSLGRWVAGGVDGATWSAGAAAALSPLVELQLGGRGNAFDPLYLSATETSVWAGVSLRIGGSRAARAPVPHRTADGQSVIRLPARSAKGAGRPSIAGDFTGWKPVPMRREGSQWTWAAKLAPGVYHYAFVAEDGTWYVPESVPGRQDDGMGGHVAVLVVS